MATLVSTVKLILAATHQNALDLTTPVDSLSKTYSFATTSGTGNNKADLIFHDNRTIATGASEKIDMFDLAIDGGAAQTDALGLAYAAVALRLLAIRITSTALAGEDLKIGGEGTVEAWQSLFHVSGTLSDTAGAVVKSGGLFLVYAPLAAGYPIADSGNDLLKIANAGASSISYDIVIVAATVAS